MRASSRKVLGAALALATGVWLATPTLVAADVPTAERIDAAKTKADHEALADEYEKLAEEAKQRSAHHTKLAEHYARIRRGPAVRPAAVEAHCEALARIYSQAAEEYQALANEHRAIAAELE